MLYTLRTLKYKIWYFCKNKLPRRYSRINWIYLLEIVQFPIGWLSIFHLKSVESYLSTEWRKFVYNLALSQHCLRQRLNERSLIYYRFFSLMTGFTTYHIHLSTFNRTSGIFLLFDILSVLRICQGNIFSIIVDFL